MQRLDTSNFNLWFEPESTHKSLSAPLLLCVDEALNQVKSSRNPQAPP
jgi:hypothetical protein